MGKMKSVLHEYVVDGWLPFCFLFLLTATRGCVVDHDDDDTKECLLISE